MWRLLVPDVLKDTYLRTLQLGVLLCSSKSSGYTIHMYYIHIRKRSASPTRRSQINCTQHISLNRSTQFIYIYTSIRTPVPPNAAKSYLSPKVNSGSHMYTLRTRSLPSSFVMERSSLILHTYPPCICNGVNTFIYPCYYHFPNAAVKDR
jgi:hypothetical protein